MPPDRVGDKGQGFGAGVRRLVKARRKLVDTWFDSRRRPSPAAGRTIQKGGARHDDIPGARAAIGWATIEALWRASRASVLAPDPTDYRPSVARGYLLGGSLLDQSGADDSR